MTHTLKSIISSYTSIFLIFTCMSTLTLLSGCNTIDGIGKDIQALGEGASVVAKDVNPYDEGEK